MSAGRSRSGGSFSGDAVEPVVEVLAEAARPASRVFRFLLVAETRRTSVRTGRVPPTRKNSFVSRARSSFTCTRRRDLADLVQEQDAAVRHLEQAGLADRGRP